MSAVTDHRRRVAGLDGCPPRARRHGRPHRHRDRALRDLRRRLPLLHRQEPERARPRRTCSTCPILASICLLSSSVTIALAVRALRARARADASRRGGSLTILLGARLPASRTAREWHAAHLRPRPHDRDQSLRHDLLLAGRPARAARDVGLVAARRSCFALALRGHVDAAHAERIEMLSWYWHFVDAVWVVVFPTVYVIGR